MITRFLKPKKNKTNEVKGIMGLNSKGPINNNIASYIMINCYKVMEKGDDVIYIEVPSNDLVKRLLGRKNRKWYTKDDKLLKGYTTPDKEFTIMVYTEFYKLVNKGYLECKKYRKNTFYKLTDKGFKNRFLFTQKAMAEEMIDLMIKRFGKSPLSIDQSIKYCGEMILNGASKKGLSFYRKFKKSTNIQYKWRKNENNYN
jgi:hypothetical protein